MRRPPGLHVVDKRVGEEQTGFGLAELWSGAIPSLGCAWSFLQGRESRSTMYRAVVVALGLLLAGCAGLGPQDRLHSSYANDDGCPPNCWSSR
jgi:hypothetical protein